MAFSLVYTDKPEKSGVYKFIRMEDGSYRWFDVYADHSSQVKEGETAAAAGVAAVSLEMGFWKLMSDYSMTLKISAKDREIKEISELLNLQFKD